LTSICLLAAIGFSFCKELQLLRADGTSSRYEVAGTESFPSQQVVASGLYRNNGVRAQLIGRSGVAWLATLGILSGRPGRPPHHVRRFHANFSYQAATWTKPRRVIAKVEWHPGELYPRVGFIVTT
jgi:hypothetical protein